MKTNATVVSLLFLLSTGACLFGQDIHPKKAVFADLDDWPKTDPGDVQLKNFQPFRAVYARSYTQGSGPGAGQPRRDRVIISAEQVGWDGREAISLAMLDSGAAQWSDTNARILQMFFDAADMTVLFELGPLPGKAKDYYIGRRLEQSMVLAQITTEDGKAQSQVVPTQGQTGFGPAAWVVANMDLHEGQKISLDRVFSMRGNPLTWWQAGRIRGKEAFETTGGEKMDAWVMESFWGLKDARAVLVFLTPEPPYFLAAVYEDLETGERKEFVRLSELSVVGQ